MQSFSKKRLCRFFDTLNPAPPVSSGGAGFYRGW